MSYFVYILKSTKDHSFYTGQTNNLKARILRHNTGQVRSTRLKGPWKLFWSCEVRTRAEAMKLEGKLKNLKSNSRLLEYINRIKI